MDQEDLPLVILEAMSYNLPMLMSDIPANREVAFTGEPFPVGNVKELAGKLKMFLKNPSCLTHGPFNDLTKAESEKGKGRIEESGVRR